METQTYPKASLQAVRCTKCKEGKPESGGYRLRRHRDVRGIREVKVLRLRCRTCKRSLGCVYPAGVLRYKWYSGKVQGIFAILDIHQVNESCADELAEHLGYPIQPATRAKWQATEGSACGATRAWRANNWEGEQLRGRVRVASLDEFKVGKWWVYTLTDQDSQAVIDYAVSSSRDEGVIRDLIPRGLPLVIAEHEVEALISDDRRESPWDGCPKIEAACEWFADIPHGRCWFHVIKEVLSNFDKEERELVSHDLSFLYSRSTLETAEWFLDVLQKRYGQEALAPLYGVATTQTLLACRCYAMPLTNNVSETLYHALWSRSRRRVVKALHRLLDWLKEACWRWNHHLIRGKSPWQRFSSRASIPWLSTLLTPLGRSTDF